MSSAYAALAVLTLVGVGAGGCAKPSGPAPDTGWARLNCAVASNGGLEDCRVVDERPADAGFGAAALKAAQSGRLSQRAVDPHEVGARVEFTTRFQLD